MSGVATRPVEETASTEDKASSPGRHWRGRIKAIPLPPGHAARQGDITTQAFLLLGKADAIAFLNTENPVLEGRPIALATQSADGQALVRAELQRLSEVAAD